MDDNRFFKFIWRLNALALAGILSFAFLMVLWEVVLEGLFPTNDQLIARFETIEYPPSSGCNNPPTGNIPA